jgi:hypothetical protein
MEEKDFAIDPGIADKDIGAGGNIRYGHALFAANTNRVDDKLETAFKNIDKIDQQIKVLINSEMYTGTYFTSYYTDPKAKIIDAERTDASIEVAKENGIIIAECSGAINIYCNRLT